MSGLSTEAGKSAEQGGLQTQALEAKAAGKAAKEPPKDRLKQMEQYFHQGDFLFKIAIAFVSAFSAAAVIVLSGIYADRMLEIIAMRAVVGFFIAGGVVFLALLWLDDVGIPLYVSQHESLQQAWLSEPESGLSENSGKSSADAGVIPETSEQAVPSDVSGQEPEIKENDGEELSFAPLDDSIQHMKTAE